MSHCYTTDTGLFENKVTNTTINSKYSKDCMRRAWYYEKHPRDKDAKKDPHPEVRAAYYRNYPTDTKWKSDPKVVEILKSERKF